ncbi:PREDICTED: mitochondrial import receptor subunit TOM40-1-like [Camelina sativa]|uniref:Mitochondrial import receptor subunit TOM40-1-like n=1 Tax=Camelina sativa TaxID=90675 RepID=A0ABM1QXE6_CAMSA|nr:PREDICTED: mitochondrial import receptor subunit TOM40-1-like [Camelina sativa]
MTKVSLEYMALNYRARFKLGSNDLTAATYIQRVTPCLSLGGEVFCTNVPQESGVGYAARYETDKMVMFLLSHFIGQLTNPIRRKCHILYSRIFCHLYNVILCI